MIEGSGFSGDRVADASASATGIILLPTSDQTSRWATVTPGATIRLETLATGSHRLRRRDRAQHRPCPIACTGSSSKHVPRPRSSPATRCPPTGVGKRRLNVAAWSHGVSIYGRKTHGDGGLTRRHPELQSSRGTIQLRTDHAGEISDEKIRERLTQGQGQVNDPRFSCREAARSSLRDRVGSRPRRPR